MTDAAGERGSALVVAVMATLVMLALGSALTLLSMAETGISVHEVADAQLLHAADSGMQRALVDLAGMEQWDAALDGRAQSALADGVPSGTRRVADATVDLQKATNELRCGQPSPCSDAEVVAARVERPWGANNPRWQVFAWGPLSRLVGATQPGLDPYVVVWVADDQGEVDGEPWRDASSADEPGHGVVAVVSQAYGAAGARRIVEATVERVETASGRQVRLRSWRLGR